MERSPPPTIDEGMMRQTASSNSPSMVLAGRPDGKLLQFERSRTSIADTSEAERYIACATVHVSEWQDRAVHPHPSILRLAGEAINRPGLLSYFDDDYICCTIACPHQSLRAYVQVERFGKTIANLVGGEVAAFAIYSMSHVRHKVTHWQNVAKMNLAANAAYLHGSTPETGFETWCIRGEDRPM